MNTNEYAAEYSNTNFWNKIKQMGLKAGRKIIEMALQLYYALLEPDTPLWAKSIIVGALGYLISPLDAIPDAIPVIGYSDDLGVITAAVAMVTLYITPEIRQKAHEKLNEWLKHMSS